MPDIQTFLEKVKDKALYEVQNPDSLCQDILHEWETNRRLSPKLAQYGIAHMILKERLIEAIPIMYRDKFVNRSDSYTTMFRSIDGWSVDKAITAEGMKVIKEQEEKKKKGFMGLFSDKGGD